MSKATQCGAVQGKISKELHQEQDKQQVAIASEPPSLKDLYPSGVYINMVIVYPADVISFKAMRPDPDPEVGKDGLKRVIGNVDDNNSADVSPSRPVNFLDKLKKFKKGSADDIQLRQTKKVHLKKSKTNNF
ncbi:hypothetical protein BX616_002493 [Lobosporangium transversale]|uniref:Uncharacterized protein n=1 Tax=Lobosporangium transversale TaxID=64571 RepID=A0A1Y2GE29_9FUNG|nr:hypothetical protein BCR41DRAFT_373288 [Lobosporangium transversale]KAF9900801.1 hypothetical protein BX616_002493 [Lobosporangium transversale]ORZ08250.1 hypothetical protein BCR41DRAFT_373288 [Lobosporangium transversale]|eukprot:XP_021878333.1 hypothetical protein BCR41DRAFT_373288 [Lobosporangium transversale]